MNKGSSCSFGRYLVSQPNTVLHVHDALFILSPSCSLTVSPSYKLIITKPHSLGESEGPSGCWHRCFALCLFFLVGLFWGQWGVHKRYATLIDAHAILREPVQSCAIDRG
jgi:hypothetical protein